MEATGVFHGGYLFKVCFRTGHSGVEPDRLAPDQTPG
jgi:hypothetical protein